MNFDKAYVISLKQNPKRRKHFYRFAKRAQLDVEWFPAIYGLDVDITDYHRRGYLSNDFELRMAGSLGTLLSHIHVWEKIAADPDCKVGLVFEDDAIIKRKFMNKLEKIALDQLPGDWDMFWLGWHKLDCKPINELVGSPRMNTKKRSVNSGHFAYLIKSSSVEKMKALLLPYNNRNSKDVILRKKFDQFKAYFLFDKIATTPLIGFDSTRKNINDPDRIKNRPIKLLIQKLRQKILG
ncbi:MAG: glycosyltransferase family 25 protein [Candidatus Marinimicrobia bacterium]|nr:glycosyltransferase family 25 protein [Candidatus Neomarinimicrobiota bacterium]